MTSYVEHGTGDADHQHQHNYKLAHYLGWALFLTGGFALVEAIGGWYSGSLALISDAGHMLTDTMALALAYFAQKLSSRAPSAKLSFGYTRIEVIAAFVNALGMLALVAWIMIQAVQRVMNPTSIDGGTVSIIAFGGLLVNLLVAWLLHRDQSSLNARAAFVHVLGDLLGSVAAIVAGLLIYYKGWQLADPILSVFVALLIVRSTWGILKDALWHLMDAVPNHIDFNRVGASLHAVEGIISVHDLHIWSMSPEQPTLMAHVLIEPHTPWPDVLECARVMLRQEYQIDHITLQPEWRTTHAADAAATKVEGSRPTHVH